MTMKCSGQMPTSKYTAACLIACGLFFSGLQPLAAQPGVFGVDAQSAAVKDAWQVARQLEDSAKTEAAFLKYLTLPGGEIPALRIAQAQPRNFLTLLSDKGAAIPAARRGLVAADLLLALQDRDGALIGYQQVAEKIGIEADQGWEQGLLPRGEYFVEPTEQGRPWRQELPLNTGPGSHRDNRLIRRFIALEAWADARREFERVWQLHSTATRPYVVRKQTYNQKHEPLGLRRHIVYPAGYSSRGLQFALDYAYFLQRRKENNTARDVLISALLLIDMDHNPDRISYGEPAPDTEGQDLPELPIPPWVHTRSGVSRPEFIRLAYGALKTNGHERVLVNQLTDRIAAGQNRLRRVLAQVRLQQGQTAAALSLELDYITEGKFDSFDTTLRRGKVFDSALQPQNAVREYESALALLQNNVLEANALKLPDQPQPDSDSRNRQAQRLTIGNGVPKQQTARRNILTQLERLYVALGRTNESLDVARQLMESTAPSNGAFQSFENLRRKHQIANQLPALALWAKQQLKDSENNKYLANLHWLLNDHKAAATSLARVHPLYDLQSWKERFRSVGPQPLRNFLQALIAENPNDAQSRLELLDLDGITSGPQLVERLEQILESNEQWAFQRGKGGRATEKRFKDQYELAYRLIRIYERAEQFDKLHALALRIARQQQPFASANSSDSHSNNANGIPERANAALAIAIQYSDTKRKREDLRAALAESVWQPAYAQVLRRMTPTTPQPETAVPWANLPDGMQLIASTENVLALAHNNRYVYSGHPWGVAVHDHNGQPVTRIALGEAARALVVINDHLWVGSPKGLFRISPADWSVSHQWLHNDVRVRNRHSNSFPGLGDYWFENSVYTLAADGDELWIGLHRNIQRLNTKTLELRAFSFDELKIKSWAGYDTIVVDDQYVWADSPHSGTRRYNRTTDEWSSVGEPESRHPVRFVAIVDGRVFGNVYVDEHSRNRLCLIDRDTLTAQTIPLITEERHKMINSVLQPFGRHDDRQIFGTDWPAYALDESTLTMRPIPRLMETFREQLRNQQTAPKTDPQIVGAINSLAQLNAFQTTFDTRESHQARHITLPNGTLVLGTRQGRIRYEYPSEDTPTSSASAQPEIKDHAGGLYFIWQQANAPTPTIRRVSAALRINSIHGDLVRTAVFGNKQTWLCTSAGVAQLDQQQHVQRTFSRKDGLCANRVTGGAQIWGKTYLSTAWGDSGGGLAVFDPQTGVFTAIIQEDGLPTEKLDDVNVIDDQLLLTFGEEYLRHNRSGDSNYRQFPPVRYEPKSNKMGVIGKPRAIRQNGLQTNRRNTKPNQAPFLGGTVSQRLEHDGRIYLCGTRGVVIANADITEPQFAALGATLRESLAALQLVEADSRNVTIRTPLELAGALKDENPFYRANAIASLNRLQPPYPEDFLPLLASQLDEDNARLRATAFYLVTRFPEDERVIPLLKARRDDSHAGIRALATLELVRRGQLTDPLQLQKLADVSPSSYPFGARSSIGVPQGANQLYAAIAPYATPEVFAWLIKTPPPFDNRDGSNKVFQNLAQSLRRHPKASDILLRVQYTTQHEWSQRAFLRNVFLHVGTDALPMLHRALQSDDRVVRSNAARACGAIKDASSIEPLLQAVNLESGLSRASIVWALGELKAKSALPLLASLYAEAQANEQRAQTGGRYAQQAASVTAQYNRISNLESIAEDWDNLTAAVLAPMIEDSTQEELLMPRHILEAVGKVGPELSQEFYRALTSSKDASARQTAATQLAAGPPADRDTNVAILKSLLTDNVARIRVIAAVGLLQLNDNSGQSVILDSLNSKNSWQLRNTLSQLARITDPNQLSFCRGRIESIAKDATIREETRREASHLLP